MLVYSCLGLFATLGCYLAALGGRDVWLGLQSRKWPQAPGMVIPSPGEATREAPAAGAIAVRYAVRGRVYITSQIRFGAQPALAGWDEFELWRWRYPPGRAVTVFYAPDTPELAVVRPGAGAEAFWLPGLGLGLLLAAAIFAAAFRAAAAGIGISIEVTLFSGTFLCIGCAMLAAGGWTLYRAYDSQSWPVAKGEFAPMGRGGEAGSVPGQRSVYRYVVDGQTHFGNRIRFGAGPDAGGETLRSGAGAGMGTLDVRYYSADPDLAVLEPGIVPGAFWMPGAGLALSLFGLAGIRYAAAALRTGRY